MVRQAAKVALGRLVKFYGRRQSVEDLKVLLKEAVTYIPRDKDLPWSAAEDMDPEPKAGSQWHRYAVADFLLSLLLQCPAAGLQL